MQNTSVARHRNTCSRVKPTYFTTAYTQPILYACDCAEGKVNSLEVGMKRSSSALSLCATGGQSSTINI